MVPTMGDPNGRNVLPRDYETSGFEPRKGISNPPAQTESRSKASMFAGDKSLCQTVSLSSWLHSGHRKMWTSESPPGLDTIAIRSMSRCRGPGSALRLRVYARSATTSMTLKAQREKPAY